MADAMLSKYGLKVAIQRIRNGGLNCADYVALTIRVLDALIKITKQLKICVCKLKRQ